MFHYLRKSNLIYRQNISEGAKKNIVFSIIAHYVRIHIYRVGKNSKTKQTIREFPVNKIRLCRIYTDRCDWRIFTFASRHSQAHTQTHVKRSSINHSSLHQPTHSTRTTEISDRFREHKRMILTQRRRAAHQMQYKSIECETRTRATVESNFG